MNSIFSDSDDCKSDVASVSKGRLSKSIFLNFDENDDTEEKRATRKSIIEKVPIKPISSNQEFVLPNCYNDPGNHYGSCIKLASENKINSKNAFSLHLIDFLQDHVKGLNHFQTVGSALDAGTKIYASRVDSVFTNTYQVLTGLGNPNEDKSDEKEDEVPQEDPLSDGAEEVKIKKSKRKINSVKNTICQNLKKIRINLHLLRSEIDPIFQSQAENFDDGGNAELRLNNIRLLDRNYELILDSDTIVHVNPSEDMNVDENELEYDTSSFLPTFDEIKNGNAQICDQFEDFLFTGWTEGSETMNLTTAESLRNLMIQKEPIIEENGQDEVMYEMEDCHEDEDIIFSNIEPEENEPVKADDDEDNLITLGSDKADSCNGNVLMSSVRDIVNSFVEQYGEINDNLIGMWAGPTFWKKKAQKLKSLKIDNKKTKTATVKPPKEVKSIFPENIEIRINDQGIRRLVLKRDWKMTKNDTISTQLTDICLNKNINKDYLLPPRTQFSFKSINQLMNREVLLVNKVFKKQAENIQRIQFTEEDKVLNYDLNQANDVVEFQPATLVTDDMGNVSCNQEDDDFAEVDAYTGNSFQGDFDAFDDPLTANVRHIEQIDIDYAKSAKRFDVKNLKARMLTILQKLIDTKDMKIIQESKFPKLYMSSRTCLFSELLVALEEQLTWEQSKDLSVPILMTCLLHLANETGLDISNTDDYNDHIIGQGYSEYDKEQINLIGIGNCLINDSRKRQSLDNSEGRPRGKKKLNVFSDEDEEDDY